MAEIDAMRFNELKFYELPALVDEITPRLKNFSRDNPGLASSELKRLATALSDYNGDEGAVIAKWKVLSEKVDTYARAPSEETFASVATSRAAVEGGFAHMRQGFEIVGRRFNEWKAAIGSAAARDDVSEMSALIADTNSGIRTMESEHRESKKVDVEGINDDYQENFQRRSQARGSPEQLSSRAVSPTQRFARPQVKVTAPAPAPQNYLKR
jgi:hypothetical protein